jgi:large subunit ribosomal protein L10
MKRAFEGTPYEALDKHLEGGNALAISTEDAVTPARILAKYVKQYKKFDFAAGVVEGTYYDGEQMVQVANIPSREILLGRLLGSMQSQVANFARVILQIAEKDAPAADTTAEA